MPPVDSTPSINMRNFELLYSLQAYNRIPVSEYISKKTGITVVIAEVEGPIVNGYFCLATETFDDDGLPHTLEHLIFLGSEEYPFKGVLDLLANRCLASGTNAWTDTDHTCYTMETAGSEGFLSLLPIYLEHILYPTLADEAFVTEVHHITPEGTNAGVVYCEMQSRENSAESRMYLNVARNIYPGKCGYSSETGGIMKNLRESTNNDKVKNFHKDFYRPENLKIVITGQVKPDEVFKALEKLETKIISKGPRGPFQRPWQSPVPCITESKTMVIKYPTDEETNGLFCIAWRGASSVKDMYTVQATQLLLKYLTEFSVSLLPKEFVEIEDPYASKVSYTVAENSEICLCIIFEDVPVEKLPKVGPKLKETLQKILEEKSIDMVRLHSIINKYKLESLSSLENSPHSTIAFMIIGHMLYGHTKEDLQQRINPLVDIEKLFDEPLPFWLNLLDKYLIKNNCIELQCHPSIDEQQNMAKEEKDRIEQQIQTLKEEGLNEKGEVLRKAVEHNEREPPLDMLTSVPIPNLSCIKFHNVERYSCNSESSKIDLSKTPVFTYFDHIKTNFVYIFAALDTSKVPSDLKIYLPLLLESILELPLERDGKIIPYETVVAQLNDDTVNTSTSLGLQRTGLFVCGNYSTTATIIIQVEAAKYETGIRWLREILYKTIFTVERLKVISNKINNSVAQYKRNGRNVVSYAMKGLRYSTNSNFMKNGVLQQNKFLNQVIEKLDSSSDNNEIVQNLEKVRKIITDPSNLVLYLAGNLDILKNPSQALNSFLPLDVPVVSKQQKLNITPDSTLQIHLNNPKHGCIIGMGCLESSFFMQTTQSISSYDNPDLPALMLYLQYLTQTEGPLWKQIRGKGYSYGYAIMVKVNEGLLYLIYSKATNVVGAYKETKEIISKQLLSKEWDQSLLDSAKSSIIFEIIDEEKTTGDVVDLSFTSYFNRVDYKFNRTLLESINKVTTDDLNRIGDKYVSPLFDPKLVKTAVVTDPSKVNELAEGFKKFDLELNIYTSLEESFLNKI